MKATKDFIKSLKGKRKITCLTAYSYPIAKILDNYCDIILVGDSLGMAIYGFNDTIDVTIDMMINHGKAVTKAAKKSLIVVDLPYSTYESSKEQALESAKKVISQTNCDAIKIEVTPELLDTAKYLVKNNINVMGHVGLLPQHVRKIGGYKYQGKSIESQQEIMNTAINLDKIGCFAIILEAITSTLADKITSNISVPAIAIGGSRKCDGQILVTDDLIGLNQEFTPKFVKQYGSIAEDIAKMVENYKKEVKNGSFPSSEHEYNI